MATKLRNMSQPVVLLALAFALTGAVQADVSVGPEEMDSKAIRVDTPESQPLRVALEPTKESFKVDEPIRFRVRGNKTFYLYLFSIDSDGDATLILPKKEGQENNKYPADTTLPVPNEGAPDFMADEAGKETLVMVASAKYLRWKSNWFLDGADSYVDKAEFEEEFAAKGIRVGAGKDEDENVVTKRLSIRIRGKDASREVAGTDVWLTTKGNREEYAMGDRIEAVFGAGADGWVQLYVVEPDGDYSRLKKYEVEKDKTYRMRAVAEDPAGKHAFVAVYTEDDPGRGTLGVNDQGKSLLDTAPKGVRVEEEPRGPMAVYRFRIEED